MITNVSIASVFVKDIDAAKAFYIDVLGLAEHTDITLPDGSYRWCTVMHPSQPELAIHLTIPGPPLSPDLQDAVNRALDQGGMFGLGMTVDDCQKTYEELTAKGVDFVQTPQDRPYGVDAVARANYASWMVQVERSGCSPPPSDEPRHNSGSVRPGRGRPCRWPGRAVPTESANGFQRRVGDGERAH